MIVKEETILILDRNFNRVFLETTFVEIAEVIEEKLLKISFSNFSNL